MYQELIEVVNAFVVNKTREGGKKKHVAEKFKNRTRQLVF